MVQILEESPSFGALFGRSIGQGAGEGFSNAMQKKQKMAQLAQEDKDILAATGIDLRGIIDPELRKFTFSEKLKGNQTKAEQEKRFAHELKLQKEKYGFEDQLLKNKPASSADIKAQKELEDQAKIKETGQKAFDGLVKLLKRNNVGYGSGVVGSLPFAYNTQKDVGQFSSLTGGLEAILVDMVSRGTLSNTRFNYITENLLPKPTDRQEAIKGKLEGLAEILDLDSSELTGKRKSSGSVGKHNKPLNAYLGKR